MAESDPSSFLGDPLSAISRLERRNLLIASTVGLLVGHIGLVPTRISALGLEFDAPAQSAFLVVLALVVAYMASAFTIYATADFFIWRKRYYDYRVATECEASHWTQEDQEEYDEMNQSVPPIHWYWQKAPLVAWLRIAFEFALPLAVGIYTAALLGLRAWRP
jgi:purine-cytosine permease-like protein